MNILKPFQIKSIIKTALEAGEIAMSYFGGDDLNISAKSDNSTLTIADSLISKLIEADLKKLTPEIPIICEEGQNRDFGDGTFWLIDPIDGTSAFSKHDPEFTINIGLIKNKKPIFGLIFAPAIDGLPLYYTDENGELNRFFVKEKISEKIVVKKRDEKDFVIISSKRISDEEIWDYFRRSNLSCHPFSSCHSRESGNPGKLKTKLDSRFRGNDNPVINKISSSLKFIYLIEGKADLYLHLRKSMEWDIAAGQALLEASGGRIMNLDGSKFLYQKSGLENQPFIAQITINN